MIQFKFHQSVLFVVSLTVYRRQCRENRVATLRQWNLIRFEIFVQALDGFLFVVNTEGRVEYVTDNITQYINYTKDDVLGKDIYNIIHHGDHNTFMPSLLPMPLG